MNYFKINQLTNKTINQSIKKVNKMLKINVKEMVLRQIERSKRYSQLTKQQKIDLELDSMRFNLEMYNKYKERKNYTRYDKRALNHNQWYLIMNIESIKNK